MSFIFSSLDISTTDISEFKLPDRFNRVKILVNNDYYAILRCHVNPIKFGTYDSMRLYIKDKNYNKWEHIKTYPLLYQEDNFSHRNKIELEALTALFLFKENQYG